jgi:hypothetical protein
MKKCPVCEREYDDNMRFCQTDGTALVDKTEPPPDPYKTMVARKEDIAAAIPGSTPPEPSSPVPPIPSPLEDQLLEIPPANDPNKTQFVSESELRAEMERHSVENQVIEVPPATENEVSDIPISGDPDMAPPAEMVSEPPPSPFAAAPVDESGPANFPTSPPIPSPFNAMPKEPATESDAQQFAEPVISTPSPFDQAAESAPLARAEFNPPSTPESNMQNPQNFGAPAAAGQSQTLSIVSLILGIAGLTICCGWFIPSVVALILGFMARGKANSNPAQYGGAGLALGGIITGAIGIIGSIIVAIYVILNFAVIMASMPR